MSKRVTFGEVFQVSKPNIDCFARITSDLVSVLTVYLVINFTSFSANILTLTALVVGVGGTVGLYFDTPWIAIAGFYISYVLDFSDGKVARLRGTSSGFGKKFDIITDRLVFGFSILGYVYYAGIQGSSDILIQYVLFALLFLLGDLFEISNALGDYYDGKIFHKPPIKKIGLIGYLKGFLQWRRWIPKRLFILFVAFVLVPSLNFPMGILIAMNIWTFMIFLRILRRILIVS